MAGATVITKIATPFSTVVDADRICAEDGQIVEEGRTTRLLPKAAL